MTELILLPKPPHGSPEWLAARHRDSQGRARLTASVAGVLFDCHPFISQIALAAQQLGEAVPEGETTPAMERGTALEPCLLNWWAAQYGIEVEIPDSMYARGRWVANLDGLAFAPVEAKTTSRRFDGELPDYWRWQGVAQAWCAAGEASPVFWVVLDGGQRLQAHDQWVTQDEIDELLSRGEDWLSYIDNGMVPLDINPKPKTGRRSFDRVAFRAEHPALYEQFLRVKGDDE